jgi:hypothetical protein
MTLLRQFPGPKTAPPRRQTKRKVKPKSFWPNRLGKFLLEISRWKWNRNNTSRQAHHPFSPVITVFIVLPSRTAHCSLVYWTTPRLNVALCGIALWSVAFCVCTGFVLFGFQTFPCFETSAFCTNQYVGTCFLDRVALADITSRQPQTVFFPLLQLMPRMAVRRIFLWFLPFSFIIYVPTCGRIFVLLLRFNSQAFSFSCLRSAFVFMLHFFVRRFISAPFCFALGSLGPFFNSFCCSPSLSLLRFRFEFS